MAYLTPSEYSEFCRNPDVTTSDIEFATGLINAIIGKSLEPTTTTETVKLKHDRGQQRWTGKLRYTPVVNVTSVTGVNIGSNGVTESEMPLTSLYMQDDYGHFMFFPSVGINSMIWGTPENLKISYDYGYTLIPMDIKVVCGSIADNTVAVKSMGGSGAKSIASLDFTVAMFDDKFYTSNELTILQRYKAV